MKKLHTLPILMLFCLLAGCGGSNSRRETQLECPPCNETKLQTDLDHLTVEADSLRKFAATHTGEWFQVRANRVLIQETPFTKEGECQCVDGWEGTIDFLLEDFDGSGTARIHKRFATTTGKKQDGTPDNSSNFTDQEEVMMKQLIAKLRVEANSPGKVIMIYRPGPKTEVSKVFVDGEPFAASF